MSSPGSAIDNHFIAKWHPKYDCTEDDQQEYERLIAKVRSELAQFGSFEKATFIDILNWKAARVKGKIDWANITVYLDRIRKCGNLAEPERLKKLVELQGIGVPVASTILHFMYPDNFPIMDIRTVEVLHKYGYIQRRSRDLKRFPRFQDAILSIQRAYPKWDLRQIDRAIFAFHKNHPRLFMVISPTRGA